MQKILVTDCNSRKALCVVRSLGKQGFQIITAGDDKVNMSRYSKYSYRFKHLPNPISNENDYLLELENLIIKEEIDVLVPMEDETVELIIKNSDRFGHVKKLLPTHEIFMVARDKAKTIKKAIEIGVSCPTTYFVEDIQKLGIIKEKIEFPVIIKPRISSGSRGLVYVDNKKELVDKYLEIHKTYPYPVIQRYVSGEYQKIQVLLVMDHNHQVKASCTYQGIREFPVDGGPVTLWKTTSVPTIEAASIEFLEKMNWIGFAEIEYIVNPLTGEYFLMEINPRFSANIALGVNIGIDFPLILVKLALKDEVEFHRNNKINEYCQWLLPGDIMNFIFNKNRFKQEVGYVFNKPKNLSYAVLSKDDPIPAVASLLSMFTNIAGNSKNLKAKLKASK